MVRREIVAPDILLDAYGKPEIYQNILRQVNRSLHVEPSYVNVKLSARVFQVVKSSAKRQMNNGRRNALYKTLEDVIHCFEPIHGRDNMMIFLHKQEVATIQLDFPGIEFRYFFQGRGIDAYSSKTCAICFGTPEPPHEEVRRLAEAIYYNDPENMSAIVPDVQTSNPRLKRDRRFQAVLELFRESEIAQSIHRIRPVKPRSDGIRASAPKDIVLIGMLDCPVLPKGYLIHPSQLQTLKPVLKFIDTHGFWINDLLFVEAVITGTLNCDPSKHWTISHTGVGYRSYLKIKKTVIEEMFKGKEHVIEISLKGQDIPRHLKVWGDLSKAEAYIDRVLTARYYIDQDTSLDMPAKIKAARDVYLESTQVLD